MYNRPTREVVKATPFARLHSVTARDERISATTGASARCFASTIRRRSGGNAFCLALVKKDGFPTDEQGNHYAEIRYAPDAHRFTVIVQAWLDAETAAVVWAVSGGFKSDHSDLIRHQESI